MAQDLGRLRDRAHGVNDAQDRSNNSQRRRRIGEDLHSVNDVVILAVMDLEFLVHHRLDLVGGAGAQGQQAQVITHEIHCVVIVHEVGELRE